MAGLIILALGVFKLGRIINFIPAPVITGFTSGIALIIFIGQIDNALGIHTEPADTSALKIWGYLTNPLPVVSVQAIVATGIVAATMILLPHVRPVQRVPAALLGISVATALAWSAGWQVATIGAIPRSIILDDRLALTLPNTGMMSDLLGPAIAIAALGAIESLLAGVVAGRMTGTKLAVNQELVAQGVGNIVIPFLGGVPATAAIAGIPVGVLSLLTL